MERDGREPEGVEVRPEEKTPETGVGEAATRPQLFSELGTGITTREVVIPSAHEADEASEDAVVTEGAGVPMRPILTGRWKGVHPPSRSRLSPKSNSHSWTGLRGAGQSSMP